MYTLIVSTAMGFLLGRFLCSYLAVTNATNRMCYLVCGAYVGLMAGFTAAIILSVLVPDVEVVLPRVELVSVGKYAFYQKLESGGLLRTEIRADEIVTIFEDTDLKDGGYMVVTVQEQYQSPLLDKWVFVMRGPVVVSRAFHVPVGTVVE